MGGPEGGGPQAQNKVQKVKSLDVWDALRKSLKKGSGGQNEAG